MADTSKLIRYFEASGSGEEARRMLDLAEQVVKGKPYRVCDFTSMEFLGRDQRHHGLTAGRDIK